MKYLTREHVPGKPWPVSPKQYPLSGRTKGGETYCPLHQDFNPWRALGWALAIAVGILGLVCAYGVIEYFYFLPYE
jgi:hypothetical protein